MDTAPTVEDVRDLLVLIEDRMNRRPVPTRLCGACGCLCRHDESCPACAYKLGVPEIATTLEEMRNR